MFRYTLSIHWMRIRKWRDSRCCKTVFVMDSRWWNDLYSFWQNMPVVFIYHAENWKFSSHVGPSPLFVRLSVSRITRERFPLSSSNFTGGFRRTKVRLSNFFFDCICQMPRWQWRHLHDFRHTRQATYHLTPPCLFVYLFVRYTSVTILVIRYV